MDMWQSARLPMEKIAHIFLQSSVVKAPAV
ncbi:hypothetical protein CCACVL1_17313 [Corchorus capsularis]|uniref:Uncharacterized protein n=1 Tax=Corchorus capsularis TaxID=210143 RepID=A0A1R3HSX5_COCAP|nr:hypothetical protein CCACVL1_17313 [Corchorus capsularis]